MRSLAYYCWEFNSGQGMDNESSNISSQHQGTRQRHVQPSRLCTLVCLLIRNKAIQDSEKCQFRHLSSGVGISNISNSHAILY